MLLEHHQPTHFSSRLNIFNECFYNSFSECQFPSVVTTRFLSFGDPPMATRSRNPSGNSPSNGIPTRTLTTRKWLLKSLENYHRLISAYQMRLRRRNTTCMGMRVLKSTPRRLTAPPEPMTCLKPSSASLGSTTLRTRKCSGGGTDPPHSQGETLAAWGRITRTFSGTSALEPQNPAIPRLVLSAQGLLTLPLEPRTEPLQEGDRMAQQEVLRMEHQGEGLM